MGEGRFGEAPSRWQILDDFQTDRCILKRSAISQYAKKILSDSVYFDLHKEEPSAYRYF
jgi:hypothetical protein